MPRHAADCSRSSSMASAMLSAEKQNSPRQSNTSTCPRTYRISNLSMAVSSASRPFGRFVLSGYSIKEDLSDKTDRHVLHLFQAQRGLHFRPPIRDLYQEIPDRNDAGVPISGIIRACNSLLIQPNPYFGAELNYYKSFRSAYDRSFETADYSAQTRAIGGAFDVNAALKESIEFLAKNSFQSYME